MKSISRTAVRRTILGFCAVSLGALSLADAKPARADESTGVALYEAAKTLMRDKKYSEACPKIESALRESPTLGNGALILEALCHENIGKTASAWGEFKDAYFAAKKAGDSGQETYAKQHIDALEPKLSKMTIKADATPGLVIKRDGTTIAAGALGTALPVDPGTHTIEATAPGYSVWSTTVTIGQANDSKDVAIPKLNLAPVVETPGAKPNTTMRTAGIVIGAAGVVGVGVGAVMGIMASGDASNAKSDATLCPNQQCTPEGRSVIDSAKTKATVATIGMAAGGAFIAGGVILIILSRPSKATEQKPAGAQARFAPLVGPGAYGATVLGSF